MAEPVAIPYMHPHPMMTTPTQSYSQGYNDYYFPDSSASQSPEDYMHAEYDVYPQSNYTYASSAYPQHAQTYPETSSHQQQQQQQPPSPKLRRGYSVSGGTSGNVIDPSKNTPPSPSSASSDKTFKQILSAIARVQTNLSQQAFQMMELTEKQSAIHDKLSYLEQSYGRTDQGVSRLIDTTECMSDDVKDVRDRLEGDLGSLRPDHEATQDGMMKQSNNFNKIFEEITKLGSSLSSFEAGYKADHRGVTDKPDTSKAMEEIKAAFSNEIKEAVKNQVRTEIKSLKHSMMSEFKDIRKMVKEEKDSPDFTPQELVVFEEDKVTKYLEKYGFDPTWVKEMDAAQKKSMLGCYCGGLYRDALNRNKDSNGFQVPCSFPG